MATAAKLAKELGLEVSTIGARVQSASGLFIGWKPAKTKDGRDMRVLFFQNEAGDVETINMMENADRPVLVPNVTYASARWVGPNFECVEGTRFTETADGDLVL